MTAEQRQYLKGAIDAHRRAALAADGDRKFRSQKDPGQIRVATAFGLWIGMSILMTLALLIESWA